MTVKLSVRAEAYVQELLRDDRYDAEFPPLAPEQLEAELLKGVRSPHRPWEPGEFRKLAERLIVEQAGQ